MKIRFEVEVKRTHLKTGGIAVLAWVVLFVVFFILGYLPLRGVTAGGRQIYPWSEAVLNASMYWSAIGLLITIVLSGVKNLKYVILQAILSFSYTLTSLWILRHPYGPPDAVEDVAFVGLVFFVISAIVSLMLRGITVLWRKRRQRKHQP